MDRGVVLSPDFHFLHNGSAFFKSAYDPNELRKYLLYWDIIDIPLTEMFLFECDDFDFLSEAGVLQRTPYSEANIRFTRMRDCYNMTLPKEAGLEILNGHELVYDKLSTKEPGKWSKAQQSTFFISKDEIQKECIEIELYNSLPVPSSRTSLADILEFKEKRTDELIEFRHYLDDVYEKIISSADLPRAKTKELEKLELATKNIYKTLKESKIKVSLNSLKSIISGVDGILGLAVGAASAPFINFSPLIAGISAAGIAISAKMIMHSHNNSIQREFTYLKSVTKIF